MFTQYELVDYPYFPRPLPQLYIRRSEPDPTKQHEYFIEIIGDTQFFVVKQQIDQYIEHYEEGSWIKSQYPEVIFVIPKSSLKKGLTSI